MSVVRLTDGEKAVLCAFDLEGRRTLADVGQQLGVRKETVLYRLNRLQQYEVIAGSMAVINIAKLGRSGYAVYAQLGQVTERDKRRMIDALRAMPNVYWMALLGGKYDFLFAVHARNIIEFDEIYSQIQRQHKGVLRESEIAARIQVIHLKRRYLAPQLDSNKAAPFFGRALEPESIDQLDRKILNALANDARTDVTKLAAIVNSPRTTVQSRIRSLEESGVIQAYYPIIHAERYGYQIYQILITVVSRGPEIRDALLQHCVQSSNFTFFVHAVGPWDFELSCEVEDAHEFQQVLAALRNKFSASIKGIETVLTFDYFLKWKFEF